MEQKFYKTSTEIASYVSRIMETDSMKRETGIVISSAEMAKSDSCSFVAGQLFIASAPSCVTIRFKIFHVE